ncbi:hypothetical protein EVAR_81932_1 [Eumeta japonica]|uniref:Uncharacterized protein n=1 Tax=Eumeta variegata TaxID=151549 RepID=A0A4C1UYK1_EUMVA|nr:hypothetical protein EVAR_81932_1 [Eumeta japonica]
MGPGSELKAGPKPKLRRGLGSKGAHTTSRISDRLIRIQLGTEAKFWRARAPAAVRCAREPHSEHVTRSQDTEL